MCISMAMWGYRTVRSVSIEMTRSSSVKWRTWSDLGGCGTLHCPVPASALRSPGAERGAAANSPESVGPRSGARIRRLADASEVGAGPNRAAEPVHGSEREKQPPRRRLHDQHVSVVRSARQQHADALDLSERGVC